MADQFSSSDSVPFLFPATTEEKFAVIVAVAARVHEKEERAQTLVMIVAFLIMVIVAILIYLQDPRNTAAMVGSWAVIGLLGLLAWRAFCSYFRTSEITALCGVHLTKAEFCQLREDDPHAAGVLAYALDEYQKY